MAAVSLLTLVLALVSASAWASTLPPPPFAAVLVPAAAPNLVVRHCDYDLFASDPTGPDDDHHFVVVSALNKAQGLVSFQSKNFPDQYITLDANSGVEAGRLGIAHVHDPNQASFKLLPGLSNSSAYTIATPDNKVVTLNHELKGQCSSQYRDGSDVVVADSPASKADATFWINYVPPVPITASFDPTNKSHPINKLYMGCHSDSGYVHEPRAFYSQMIIGESFEAAPNLPVSWNWIQSSTAQGSASFTGDAFHGKASLQVSYQGGTGLIGSANRGLGNEGLYFEQGKAYEGYFFVKSDKPVSVVVEAQDFTNGNKTIASTSVSFAGGNWTLVNFSFVTSAETPCVGIQPGSDPSIQCGNIDAPSHVCVRCGGQVAFGLSAPGTVNIDYTFLQPGAWGRLGNLEVLASGINTLKSIGVTSIRQGGSFTDPAYYFWKNWRGKPWERPSLGASWGAELISGWGPFEFVDMCNKAGFRPIVTTTAQATNCCDPEDMADLIEYCWGDADTQWGKVRIADGHPSPFNVTVFELGNEQYNSVYVDQVAAMEARAKKIGMGGQFYYMFPSNGYLNDKDLPKAEALGLKDHLLADIHNPGTGAVEESQSFFSKQGLTAGTINCETNAATHTMQRALMEGSDMSDFFNAYFPSNSGDGIPRLKGRTASFCNERSGHYDAFDQGLTFFLPNMTWIQPPGYVHQMIHETWQPYATAVAVSPASASVSVQVSEDGRTARVMVTNNGAATTLTLNVQKGKLRSTAQMTTLSSSDLGAANPPGNPTQISPVTRTVPTSGGKFDIPAYSFSIIVLDLDF